MHRKAMIQFFILKDLLLPSQIQIVEALKIFGIQQSFKLFCFFVYYFFSLGCLLFLRIREFKLNILGSLGMHVRLFCPSINSCFYVKYIALGSYAQEQRSPRYVPSMHYRYVVIRCVTHTPLARKRQILYVNIQTFPAHFRMIAYQRAKSGYEEPNPSSEAAYRYQETTESPNKCIIDPKREINLIKNVLWQVTFISYSGSQTFKK